jgi:hypothetical protein
MLTKDTLKQFLPSRARTLPILLFLTLLPPAFFWRETLGERTLGDQDAVFWFFPAYKFVAQQIKSGSLPLWNPYQYSGAPMFAEWQAGALDPINWVYLIGTTSRSLTFSLEMGFALALLSMFAYARGVGMRREAAVLSAVIYGLSGFIVARTLYPGFLHIVALAPSVLYFTEKLYRRERWRYVAGGALIVAWQVFAAHPQPLIYSSLLACAYALFCAFLRRGEDVRVSEGLGDADNGSEELLGNGSRASLNVSERRDVRSLDRAERIPRLPFLTKFALMFVAGMGLSAVQLLPAAEFATQSVRREWPFELFTLHSLHPLSLLTTLFPFFHGEGSGIYRMPYWGVYWHHNEAQIYLGVTALSLAVAGGVYAWRVRFGVGVFWTCAAFIGVILALGKYAGPIARALYHLPVIGNFRSPNRHWMEVTMAVAFLAGYAVDRLLREESRPLARGAQAAAATLTALCLAIGAFVLRRRDLAESFARSLPGLGQTPKGFLQSAGAEFYLPIITSVCALAAVMVFTRARRRDRAFLLLLALLLVDYHLYAAHAPITNLGKLETLIGTAVPESLKEKQSEFDPARYHIVLTPALGEFKPIWFYGSEMVTGYDPVLSERYKTFSGVDEAGRSFISTTLDPEDQTLDLLNARYVFAPPELFNPEAAKPDGRGLEVELRNGRAAIFKTNESGGDSLLVVSSLVDATDLADGEEVADLEVSCQSGERWRTTLRAGQDTSEWAYDRPDVRSAARHARARIAESWSGDASSSFQGHSYLVRIDLPANLRACQAPRAVRAQAKARGAAGIVLKNVSFETASGRSIQLAQTYDEALGNPSRWREVPERSAAPPYRDCRIFENLRALPRAWLAPRARVAYDGDQLKLIRGEMAGQRFDPGKEALVEPVHEDKNRWYQEFLTEPVATTFSRAAGEGKPSEPPPQPGAVTILDRKPGRILVEADTAQRSILILSEIAYPGWQVQVDGKKSDWGRVDYMLVGVPLAEGRHVVSLVYRPASVKIGAIVSITTALCLIIGLSIGRQRGRGPRVAL